MRIGTKLPPLGEQYRLNKWYVSFELLKGYTSTFGKLGQDLMVCCFKILGHGEPYKFDGRELKMKGGRKWWQFPYGITIHISR